MTNYTRTYYTTYSESEDKTFIMCEDWRGNTLLSVSVVGFHYGEPDNHSMHYIGNTVAKFED